MSSPNTFDELISFLQSKRKLQTQHVYKPAMLLAVIRAGGSATKQEIATEFLLRDTDQINYYRSNTVHQQPGWRLVRDGLLEKRGDTYFLNGVLANLTPDQLLKVEEVLESRIAAEFADGKNPFGGNNNDAIRGSDRDLVIRRASGRCEACGISVKDKQIDVDHIIPRSKRGPNDLSNYQALCRTCNSQKGNKHDTDFRAIQQSYDNREDGCLFCEAKSRWLDSNQLAFVIADRYPVSNGHSLIIPKRHVSDYFDLYMPERNAVEELIHRRRQQLLEADRTIVGFNIGINVGEAAGQSVFHCHVHLIPRREADQENSRGGVRKIFPEFADY